MGSMIMFAVILVIAFHVMQSEFFWLYVLPFAVCAASIAALTMGFPVWLCLLFGLPSGLIFYLSTSENI